MRHLAAVLALVVAPAPALADADAPTGPLAPLAVHARLERTSATLRLRYAVNVRGPAFDRGIAQLDMPFHGMVTSASAAVDGAVHRLALDAAEHAAADFEELATEASAPHRRWAIHLAAGAGSDITVDLAVPHAARVVLDLEVTVPTCFVADTRYFAIPKTWRPALEQALAAAESPKLDERCDNALESEHLWIGLPSRELAERPFGDQRIGALAGRLDLSTDHVARVELALAQRISQVPPDLATVFLVDGSRSMSAQQLEAQQAIIASYLRLAPLSRVQVIAYDRKTRALLPGWTPAEPAASRIARELGALAVNNGSNVDLGLETAASWLARIDGTRRVVVFTDELVSDRVAALQMAALRAKLPEGTLVHVVALGGDTGALDRDDAVLFGELAKLTEGIGVRGRVDDRGRVDATQLVRPIALERVAVHGPGWEVLSPGVPTLCHLDVDATLGEGASCEWWAHGAASAGPVQLEGVVWNHKIARVLRPDPSASRTVARSLAVFGANLGDDLAKEIDRAAFAIDSVWSMIGAWGGTGGYADVAQAGVGFGISGCGCGGGSSSDSFGVGHFGTIGVKLDLKAQLEAAIDERCHRDGARVDIALELTRDEIVDVEVTTASRELHDCAVEAVWDTAIVLPQPRSHARASVTIGA